MYRMDAERLDTLASGEVDYEHLRARLAANAARPAIINVNVGTTVKGAVDDLDRILAILADTGYSEDRFYIHCDGALFGLMVRALKLWWLRGWAYISGTCSACFACIPAVGVLFETVHFHQVVAFYVVLCLVRRNCVAFKRA